MNKIEFQSLTFVLEVTIKNLVLNFTVKDQVRYNIEFKV